MIVSSSASVWASAPDAAAAAAQPAVSAITDGRKRNCLDALSVRFDFVIRGPFSCLTVSSGETADLTARPLPASPAAH